MASWLLKWTSLTLLSSTFWLGIATDAGAQSDTERAGARAAAEAGLAAYNAGRFSESLDLLTRAESLVHALPHLLYMARASDKLNQLVQAREIYLKITREQLIAGAPRAFIDAQQSAQQELQVVESRLPYLTVNVDGARNVKVTMDDKEIPSVLIGVPFPVDPGNHVLIAESALGQRGEPVRMALAEGKRERVTLKVANSTAPATPGQPTPATPATANAAPSNSGFVAATPGPEPRDQPKHGHSPILTYGALGVGALGAIVGTVFVVQRGSKQSDADSAFDGCKTRVCDESEKSNISSLDKSAATAGNLALVSYGVGAAALSAGLYLLFTSDSKATAIQRTRTILPYVGPTQIGATLRF